MKKEQKIYEIEQRIVFYKMQKTNLSNKTSFAQSDYTWDMELSRDIAALQEWIEEIKSEGVKVSSAGEVTQAVQ